MAEKLINALDEEIKSKEQDIDIIKGTLKNAKKELNQLTKMKKKIGGM